LYNMDLEGIRIAKMRGNKLYNLSPITSIVEDKNNSLWLGTNSGALRLQDSDVAEYGKDKGLTDNGRNKELADAEGNSWFASDRQGLFRFSGAQFTVLDESMGLPSAQVMSIATYYGKLYLGTYDAGLYTYEDRQIYRAPLPLQPSPAIMAMRV